MPWKNEIDRLVLDAVLKGMDDRSPDFARLITLVNDFVAIHPIRPLRPLRPIRPIHSP